MKDCNGKELSVGDRVFNVETIGSKGTKFDGPSEWVIGEIRTYYSRPFCITCGGAEYASREEFKTECCGCVLMKITPDPDQFEKETDKELEHAWD